MKTFQLEVDERQLLLLKDMMDKVAVSRQNARALADLADKVDHIISTSGITP